MQRRSDDVSSGVETSQANLLAGLVADASARYRPSGRFAWHFARGKLANDPLFATLLRVGAIPDAACLVDLGCGQGLLAAWLYAARAAWVAAPDAWPPGWPAPPKVGTYLGIDRAENDVARAKRALPPFARVFRGDVRKLGETMLDRCDVATLFDVLQYLDRAAQERLLAAVHAGMPPWGALVLRVGDGAASGASRWANAVDLVVSAARGQPHWRLNRRPLAEWTALLARIGFVVEVLDHAVDDAHARSGRAFANVVLRASRPVAPTAQSASDATHGTGAPPTVR